MSRSEGNTGTTFVIAGLYTCQVNIVDDVAGTFTFSRLAICVR
ncbi:MAG TPA: hypothetical protein VGF24_14325 [Vicinamibacterales bacterium]|jgi:hypothetical protein